MAITHNTPCRTVIADAVCNPSTGVLSANAQCVIYSGTPPANAATALSGNTAISTITALNFGAASAGVSTVTSSTADSNAVGGTATFFRLLTNGGTVVMQGSAGVSGTDMIMNNVTVSSGANVSLVGSNTYTAAP